MHDIGMLPEKIKRKIILSPCPKPELGDCWVWIGTINWAGYAVMSSKKYRPKQTRVQRYAYTLFRGPIPLGFHTDHLCRVRACVNPGHLEAVTRGENVLRGFGPCAINARKTTCYQGHPFSGLNSSGRRICKVCKNNARSQRREGKP